MGPIDSKSWLYGASTSVSRFDGLWFRVLYNRRLSDGGEGGHKMQDDKDDGALYLVDQGLADPDKLAMFGWSYGGYAALIAATREDRKFTNVLLLGRPWLITSSSLITIVAKWRGSIIWSIEQIKMWEESISPIKEVEKVNIPLFVIHGSVDQRVPPEHARKYIKALQKYDIPHKVMWLEDADHFVILCSIGTKYNSIRLSSIFLRRIALVMMKVWRLTTE